VQFNPRSRPQREQFGPKTVNRAAISTTRLNRCGVETFNVVRAGSCSKIQNEMKEINRGRVVRELHKIYIDRNPDQAISIDLNPSYRQIGLDGPQQRRLPRLAAAK
jgi:hypothetical protein